MTKSVETEPVEQQAGHSTRIGITLRRAHPEDLDFLFEVYAGTREEELALLRWNAEDREVFLKMQFEAQYGYYQEQFPAADFLIIEKSGARVGRLYLDRRIDEIRIIDIALLPRYRGQGAGENLMRDILSESERKGLPVRIHVEKNNRAWRLYDRLGFRTIEDRGVYHFMEWTPNGLDK